MSQTDAREVVQASIDAYNKHDLQGCLACFAPDATWEIVGVDRSFPLHDITLVMEQYFAQGAHAVVRGMAASDTLVAVEYLETFTDEWTHVTSTRALAIFYEVKQGKIQHARQYAHADWVAPRARDKAPAP